MRTVSLAPVLLVGVPLLLTGACHASANWSDAKDARDKSVHIAMDDAGGKDRMSVNIPGFDAKVALPALDLGRHVDLDGIRMAPDTSVGNIDINGQDRDGAGSGHVRLSFTNPQPPALLIDYYRRSATEAGYGAVTAGAGALTATKGAKQFALAVSPQGSGSRGTITVTGAD